MAEFDPQKEIESLQIQGDFDYFLEYIANNKVKLTKSGYISPKDCYNINQEVYHTLEGNHPKIQHRKYPLLWMFFVVGLSGGLLQKNRQKSSFFLELNEELYDFFNGFNKVEKYFYLLSTIWMKCNYRDLKADDYGNNLEEDFYELTLNLSEELNSKKDLEYLSINTFGQICLHYEFLGFWDCTVSDKFQYFIRSIKLTALGKSILKILIENRPFAYWNMSANFKEVYLYTSFMFLKEEREDITEKEIEKQLTKVLEEDFIEIFKPYFRNTLIKEIKLPEREVVEGNYIFKIQPIGFQCWRKIAISGNDSFENLHIAIQEAFDFEDDHLYVFYLDGKFFSEVALNDERGGEPPFAHQFPIKAIGMEEGHNLAYLFDFGDEWRFELILEEIKEVNIQLNEYQIIESKGEAPEQYPYSEEWDEDDEDWEEDED